MRVASGINPEKKISNSSPDGGEITSFAGKVVKGSFWVLGLRLTNRTLGLIRTFVLARLLLPEDFGLIGIATISISIIETFSQPGLGTALIQKKEAIQSYLDTAWTTSILRCIIIYIVLILSAPYVTQFFDAPEAKIVIQIFGLSVVIAGFRNIGIIYFLKELDFKKQYLYELSILLGNIIVALPAAFILRNVWALVLGGIAGSITRLIMSYVLHPFRPGLRFDKEKFGDLFRFGKWVFGSSILAFIISQGDDLFLGKMFGLAALGLYQMAFMVSNLPTTETSNVISLVTFPAYSKIQNDLKRFGKAYLNVMRMITFIATPFAGAIFIFSSDLVRIFLSEKWLAVAPIVKVLVWAGLVKALIDATSSVFNAAGKPKINTKWQLINFLVLGLLIYPLSKSWGVVGVSIAVLVSNATAAFVSIYEANKILGFKFNKLLKLIAIPLLSMLASISFISWFRDFLYYEKLIELLLLVISGGLLYMILILLLDRIFNYGMTTILKESIISLLTERS